MAKKFKDPLDGDFAIPNKFWDDFREFSAGGYLAFYIDNHGSIQVHGDFNSEVSETAIRSWATSFLNSVNQSRDIARTQEFLNNGGDDEGPCNDPSCDICNPDK